MFGGPDIPPPPPPPAAPDPNSSDAATAAETRRKQEEAASLERKARGRSSTMMNGVDSQANVSRRTLLGS